VAAEVPMMRRLLALIDSVASEVESETVFAWLEEDLRARLAK
jgi:hypothetical protein